MAVERKEKIIVGVNDFISKEPPIQVLLIDESVGERQIAKLKTLRSTRDNGRVTQTLDSLRQAAKSGNVNMMPAVLDCVRCYTTLGEICDTLRAVYGAYEEPVI
jgi:methylmalonyl-CoA mutase N-terminal domain/subunit